MAPPILRVEPSLDEKMAEHESHVQTGGLLHSLCGGFPSRTFRRWGHPRSGGHTRYHIRRRIACRGGLFRRTCGASHRSPCCCLCRGSSKLAEVETTSKANPLDGQIPTPKHPPEYE